MLRLVALCLLFLLSLLCIISAPTYHLWLLAIMVTEFPWIFILITIGLLVLGIKVKKHNRLGTIIGVLALVQLCFPIMMAYRISDTLDSRLEKSFTMQPGTTQTHNAPFSLLQMITGINTKQIACEVKEYDTAAGKQLTLDLYPAQVKGRRPCVIVIHGGSWAGGDSRQLPELNSELAKLGYNVASINYRLAPKYQFPAPVEDVHMAMQYLRANAEQLKIDTNNFILLGRSAGAQIAMLAAYTFHDPAIKGVVSFYGPADMVWGYSLPANPLVLDSRKVMEDYLGGTYAQVPDHYFQSSPVEFVSPQSPPILMIHGPNDPLVAYEHNIRLIVKLKQHSVRYCLLTLPWATHGCDYTLHGPGGQLSTYAVEKFISAVVSTAK